MSRVMILLCLPLFLWNCSSGSPEEGMKSNLNNSTTPSMLVEVALPSSFPIIPETAKSDTVDLSVYPQEVKKVKSARLVLLEKLNNSATDEKQVFLDSVGKEFQNLLLHNLIPYWYGTEWDFNGYTNTPNDGVIACGYFVSTTLKHMGINLNRYTFAQQAAYYEAKTLLFGDDPIQIRPKNIEALKIELDQMSDGLYMVGLDNHVGFLLLTATQDFFIHSDYVSDEVKKERIEESPAFRSQIYCIAPISENAKLMEYWLFQKKVSTVTP